MKKNTIYKIIFGISSVIFIICALLLIKMYIPETPNKEQYTNAPVEGTGNVLPANPINFKKLKKINPDVYAWIKIPDTNINYEVVQSPDDKDDLFYMNHDINGNYKFEGMIFSQRKNSLNFSDPVTVLYGHNMKNGSMFNHLHKFEDKDFFDKHKAIYIYTPGHIYEYTIVSAYVYDNRHILNTFDFSKKKDLKEYINSLTNPHSFISNAREDVSVTTTDKILTLSTCTSNDTQRYLVQGVLTNDTITQ